MEGDGQERPRRPAREAGELLVAGGKRHLCRGSAGNWVVGGPVLGNDWAERVVLGARAASRGTAVHFTHLEAEENYWYVGFFNVYHIKSK